MLRRLPILTITLLILASLACQAATKPAKPPAKPNNAAQNSAMAKALGLSKKQSQDLNAIITKGRADAAKVWSSKASENEKRSKMMAIDKAAMAKINAMLTPAQRKKFAEMMKPRTARTSAEPGRPAAGSRGVGWADAVQASLRSVKPSSAQTAKIDAIMKDFHKQRAKLPPAAQDPAGRKKKAVALKDSTMKKLEAVLTPAQRTQFKAKFQAIVKQGGTPAAGKPGKAPAAPVKKK